MTLPILRPSAPTTSGSPGQIRNRASRSDATQIGEIDRFNRRTYASRRTVRHYGQQTGWLDAGERAAVRHAVDAGAAGPVLDIGVGGGRTVPLMREISRDYVGIDYVPQLVGMARRNWPNADLREMDARRLDFPDGQFGLVAFSFNGIDSVDDAGRAQILCEVRRVLCPGGYFVFSALNHHGRADRDVLPLPRWSDLRRPQRLLQWPVRALLTHANLRRQLHLTVEADGRSRRAVAAHFCGLVGRYTSVAEQCRELEQDGFLVEACHGNRDGEPIDRGDRAEQADYVHYVARRAM